MSNQSSRPEDLLLGVLRLRDRWEFGELVKLCDPASVDSFFRMQCGFLRPMSIQDFRVRYPDIPDADAPTAFARLSQKLPSERHIANAIPGITSYAELEALSPTEFLARWLEANDPRYEIVKRLQARGEPVPQSFLRTPAGLSYRIERVEPEDAHTVSVEYAIVASGDGRPTVMSTQAERVRQHSTDEWRMLVTARFLQPWRSWITRLPPEFRHLFGNYEKAR